MRFASFHPARCGTVSTSPRNCPARIPACSGSGRPADLSAYPRFTVPLLACFVWAFFLRNIYKVTSVDELFRERIGTKGVVAACFATSTVLLAALYFSRNMEFPRGFFVFSLAVLLVLAVLLRAIFRCAAANSTTPAPRAC
jgi:hypothetical protein